MDVGGHALYVECRGSGLPTVLFHNGAGGSHHQWNPIFLDVAARTRACRYDLPNTGDSDALAQVRSARDDVRDLEGLEAAGVLQPPYVMVAFSAGAFPAWLYAAEHGGNVAAMVFVDPLLPGYEAAWQQQLPADARQDRQRARAGDNEELYDFEASEAQLARAGLPRVPLTLIANDRHIRWESCPSTCEGLTPIAQGLIDDLVARWPQATAIRVQSPHLVVDHHPGLVRDEVLRLLPPR